MDNYIKTQKIQKTVKNYKKKSFFIFFLPLNYFRKVIVN